MIGHVVVSVDCSPASKQPSPASPRPRPSRHRPKSAVYVPCLPSRRHDPRRLFLANRAASSTQFLCWACNAYAHDALAAYATSPRLISRIRKLTGSSLYCFYQRERDYSLPGCQARGLRRRTAFRLSSTHDIASQTAH